MENFPLNSVVSQVTRSKLKVITDLQTEIDHFTDTLQKLEHLPSCKDQSMLEAYIAYQSMVATYREMISVREQLINELRASL